MGSHRGHALSGEGVTGDELGMGVKGLRDGPILDAVRIRAGHAPVAMHHDGPPAVFH